MAERSGQSNELHTCNEEIILKCNARHYQATPERHSWKIVYLSRLLISVYNILLQQESVPVGCIPPVLQRPPWTDSPNPQEGTWDQADRQEVASYRDPPGRTDTCKNITLPQTLFTSGKICFGS